MTTDTALAVTKRVIDDGCMFLLLSHRIIDTTKCCIVALDKIPYVVRSLFMEFFSQSLRSFSLIGLPYYPVQRARER